MIPVIALVGRPNVGKSTLFNRLTRSRDALVADLPGLTRDRKYGEGRIDERDFIVIDTGGISGDERGIDSAMAEQSLVAIDEADVVVFLVDGRSGLNPADEMIAKHLRMSDKPYYLAVNKTDGVDPDVAMADFYEMGLTQPIPIAASHGRGVRSLIDEVLGEFPEPAEIDADEEAEKGVRIAIVGRPNVGKSTLVNRMLGEDRVVVYDQPGTTRDSIYIPYVRHDKPYTLIDTAGVRRRKNIKEAVEKFSIVKTLQAIKDAHVVVTVMDAQEGMTEQDLHMLGFVLDSGRALVIAVNKWDGMTAEEKDSVRSQLERRLVFTDFANIHFISALHGSGVGNLYESIEEAYASAMGKWSTSKLTKLLEDVVADHQPPLVHGRRIKLRYAHQGGSNPPLFIVHGNQTDQLPASYKRYLQNKFISVLKIKGTPVRFEFKSGDNPFEGKKNVLSRRQLQKKERLKEFTKKSKKKSKKR
ncbi:ribosome biogenesis GTPase Der [Motiliproteus sp. MSK22-1]|uniref:ribosome biogenesis GTPase Der n=1 Tax=Motiliproteus sp. MSK22-1 TaxID=1897630 RepID=UPI000976F911|nr:ribosome biogenesis GTPase Der [Motiliproteus sp. MSK22-1]OMH30925.1 ribosome biogenesis GTPase Der [Motiliproteus sp. MSK22-1]